MATRSVSEQSPSSSPSLRRAVSTTGLFLFILGDVLGAGVYVLAGSIAATSGGAVWVPLVVALVLALFTAAAYAELATKYPRAGGSSHYATRAFGPFVGFLVGFCMLAAGIVSVGALALGFAGDYLGAFVTLPAPLVVVVFLALLAALNARGIAESMGANAVATIIEVGGLVQPTHHLGLGIGLAHLHLEPQPPPGLHQVLGQLGMGGAAVDLRLPLAQPAQVDPVQHQHPHRRSSCPDSPSSR